MKKIITTCFALGLMFTNAQASFVSGVPYFYQYNNSINPGGSCQNTSIAMVIKFYGGTAETPDAVSGYYGTSQAQTPAGLQQVFNSEAIYFNLPQRDVAHTNGTFGDIQTLLTAGKPVIVHGYFTGYGHVMVVTGYNGTTYTCNDPAGRWSQVYGSGGYSQMNSTEGHSVTYSKSNFESAIGPTGTIWYHEIVNTSTVIIAPPTGTVDAIAPTTLANIVAPTAYKTSNFTVNFTDADNSGGSGIDRSFYSVLDWNGTEWRANINNGFLCDNFDATIHTDWTTGTGTWVTANNLLNQTDNVNTNTAFGTTLNQSLSNRYIYHWLGNIGGTGTNRSAGVHIMSDTVTSTNRGNSYLVLFKADAGEVQIFKTINNVLGSPIKTFTGVTINTATWYDYKVMYDRTTGKFTIWMNDDLIGTHTDTGFLTTGTGFSFKTTACTYNVNNLKVYRSRLAASAVVSIGSSTADIRFQSPDASNVSYSCKIKTVCVDNASNISAVGNMDALIDWTAPSAPSTVNDGTAADITGTTSLNTLNANFTMCTDVNSGIAKYIYFIGTAANDSSLVGATSNSLSLSILKTGLNLVTGSTYYVSVYGINNAGLKSPVTSSNGQLAGVTTATTSTTTATSTVTAVVEQTAENRITVYPNPNNGNFTIVLNDGNKLATLVVTNILGEIIEQQKITTTEYNFEKTLAKGLYTITLLNDDKQIIGTKKIVVH